jgi:rhodanese-related sulfurtransferase
MECHHSARRAVELGYREVFVMPSGITGWTKAGKRVVQGNAPS